MLNTCATCWLGLNMGEARASKLPDQVGQGLHVPWALEHEVL
jgi:hypothetical protein